MRRLPSHRSSQARAHVIATAHEIELWIHRWFTRLESRLSSDGREQWLNWVIRLPASELVGYVQATVRPDARAAIAYALSSKYWGRGFARQAVQAMISELVESYHVRGLSAVLKQENLRSRRLLERLGFSLASPQQHATSLVEPDEFLMFREVTVNWRQE